MDNETEQVSIADTARILSEALPFMQRYDEEVVVVKYGGHAMVEPSLARRFASDIVLLKQCGINPIVVHGGGPQINRMLDKLQVKSDFVDGLRVTDRATMEVVEMVLAGSINKSIVNGIQQAGGKAVGISDGGDTDAGFRFRRRAAFRQPGIAQHDHPQRRHSGRRADRPRQGRRNV
jgi:hypothetical protein